MGERLFLVTSFNLIDNEKYRSVMVSNKGIEMTYMYLRRNIIRAPMRDVYKREVFDKYYMKGKLATTSNEKDLSKKLFISNHTIRRNMEILEKNKFIEIENLNVRPGGPGQKPQKVYVLGRWISEIDLEGEEHTSEFLFVFDILKSEIFT